MVFSMIPAFTLTASAEIVETQPAGSGTEADPFRIGTAGELAWFRTNINNGGIAQTSCAELTADIDLSGDSNWTPIGTDTKPYQGTFDGKNHRITNMTASGENRIGFIGCAQNLTLRNLYVSGTVTCTVDTVGGLVGELSGKRGETQNSELTNCSFFGTANGCVANTGGLIGHTLYHNVTLRDCFFVGTLNGCNMIGNDGGFIGCVEDNKTHLITIERCGVVAQELKIYHNSGCFVGQAFSDINVSNSFVACDSVTMDVSENTQNGILFGDFYYTANLTNVHVYTNLPSSGQMSCSNNNPVMNLSNTYLLGDTPSSFGDGKGGVLDAAGFKDATNFNDWDFETVWKMGENYPVLKPRAETEVQEVSLIRGQSTTVDLSKCFILVNDINQNNTQTNRFNYEVISADGSENPFVDNNLTSITDDTLTINTTGVSGTYPITVKAVDPNGECDDFTITINTTVIKPTVNDADASTKTMTAYTGTGATLDLSDCFTLENDPDDNYETSARFQYEITDGNTVTVGEGESAYTKEIASINGDNLEVTGDAPLGSYTFTVKMTDPEGNYDPYTFTVTATVKKSVPVPTVVTEAFPFSTAMRLKYVELSSEDWSWTKGSICPQDADYEAYYKFDSEELADYYDWADVLAAHPEAEYDSTLPGIRLKLHVSVTESDESPWKGVITVINADNGEAIEGAALTCDYESQFPEGNTTAADGTVNAEMSKGKHTVTVSKDGFTTKDFDVEFEKNNSNAFTLKIVPVRGTYKAPLLEDDENNDVPNAKVVITRTTVGGADAWEEESGGNSVVVDAGGDVQLPAGDYTIKPATNGYSTGNTIYAHVDDDKNITYYEDAEHTTEITIDPEVGTAVIVVYKLDEPKYTITLDRIGETDKYTATVSLVGVKATMGTIGLRYDKDIFSLDESDVEMQNGLELKYTPEDLYWSSWDNNGYYDFIWMTPDNDGEGIDAETSPQNIAVFTFTLVGDPDYITLDTIGIKPWQETAAYKEFIGSVPDDYEDISSQLWRYCDKDNNKLSLKTGRIEASKAVINGVDTGGFFQVAKNLPPGGTESSMLVDVKTVIVYNVPITHSIIRFNVTDKDDKTPINLANIRIFDETEKKLGDKETNQEGAVSFAVDTSASDKVNLTYTAYMSGYWPLPLSGLVSDRPSISAETGKIVETDVKLEKKIYHVPVIAPSESQSLELVQDADLGGEKYAYNGRDFHFRVTGARGYKITRYPTKAEVIVYDTDGVTELKRVSDIPIEEDMGIFTLKGEHIDQRVLTADELTALKETSGSGYEDWNSVQPDTNEGYRSFNLVIRFNDFDVEEIEYTVEGMTNGLGHVSYEQTPDGAVPQITDTTGMEIYDIEFIQAKTTKKQGDTPTNHQTGTFIFTGDTIDDVVERVYINGLEVDTYNGEHSFAYTFDKASEDCNITVIFWDGITPATDTVMTLIVGEFGTANVTEPDNLPGLTNTKHTFLNKNRLVFSTEPENGSYVLNSVMKEINGENMTDITSDDVGGVYTVDKEDKNVTVYVTFRNITAETSPNLFVKSYVASGVGYITPVGVKSVRMYDSIEFELTTSDADSWMVKDVKISPFSDLEHGEVYEFNTLQKNNTYRYDSIRTNIAIGAEFVEKSYALSGTVDLSQNASVTLANPKTGATLTFVRVDSSGKESPKAAKYVATTTAKRKDAAFTVDLPAGRWNVYVTKPGYVTYMIKDYDFDPNTSTAFGNGKSIVTYIGSTETGTTISLKDAANIKSGLRSNVSSAIFNRADVDNNGAVEVRDMTYVMKNYNKKMIIQSYSDFLENGSANIVKGIDQ